MGMSSYITKSLPSCWKGKTRACAWGDVLITTSVFPSRGRVFTKVTVSPESTRSDGEGEGTDRPHVHTSAAFPTCCHFFFLKHSLAQCSPKSPMRPCLCSPKFPALCETSRKRMCLGNTLCLCNFVAPRYAQTNPNQARCIKAPSTLAAPVTPVVFPSLV